MRTIFILLFAGLMAGSTIAQSTTVGTLSHGGLNRSYRLRLPANHDKNIPIPLVFNFHGYTSNAAQQELYSGMNAVADTARFAVCYPDGIQNAWNVGWAFGSTADDVGFTSALIEALNIKYGIDKSRVYACGMSNGGFMSYTLACELSDKIVATASVTGSMVPNTLTSCTPDRAVPVMEIHGTADGTVNYNGTPLISIPIPEVMEFWQQNNGCDVVPIKETLPDINTSDGTTTEKYTYTNCKDKSKLIHYKVINGGHTWPGSIISIGATSQDFNASAEIWRFFRPYKLENISTISEEQETEYAIFPNPCSDKFNISTGNRGSLQVIVSDMQGRVVIKGQFTAGNEAINTTHLQPGAYVVHIKEAKNIRTFKLIKM